jgi:hypothetical protein
MNRHEAVVRLLVDHKANVIAADMKELLEPIMGADRGGTMALGWAAVGVTRL